MAHTHTRAKAIPFFHIEIDTSPEIFLILGNYLTAVLMYFVLEDTRRTPPLHQQLLTPPQRDF